METFVAAWFFVVGACLIALGVAQAVVGTDRIVGRRSGFEDFAVRGRPVDPGHVVRWLAGCEIASGILALVLGFFVLGGA